MTASRWRYILHADLDAFYASVEQHDNPGLLGKAVVVGGSPESRGVVAAASYEARKFGIRSAMPMRTAVRLCPDLVRVSPRFGRYHEVSRGIMDLFEELTDLVEPLSLDEAYMDISEKIPREEVGTTAKELKQKVREHSGLAVTIGGGTSKTVSKIASQVAKPDGLLMIPPGREPEFLKPLDVEMLWGIGPKTSAILRAAGIDTLGQLAECEDPSIVLTLGRRGSELKSRALGLDENVVTPNREAKSISSETTLDIDVDEPEQLLAQMRSLSQGVAVQLQSKSLKGRTVWIKLRLADFTTFTRQLTVFEPTDRSAVIYASAKELLSREMGGGRQFRLLGVGVGNFQEHFQLSLLPSDWPDD